ncbi:MAG: hypothetical protein IKD62_01270, partial [Oscillospiraceae bacterium]|nr:hypothetical protein [Oscillospiraceae bacterium]
LLLTSGTISISESMFCFDGWVCAACLCVTVLSFRRKEAAGAGTAVNLAASFTEGVYLIHIIMNEWLFEWGIKGVLIRAVTNGADTTWQYMKFAVLYALAVFLFSAAAVALIRLILTALRPVLRKGGGTKQAQL